MENIYALFKSGEITDESECCLIYSEEDILSGDEEENEKHIKSIPIHTYSTSSEGIDTWGRTRDIKGLEFGEKITCFETPLKLTINKKIHEWTMIIEVTQTLRDSTEEIINEIIRKININKDELLKEINSEIDRIIDGKPKIPKEMERLIDEGPEAYKKLMEEGVAVCSSLEEFTEMLKALKEAGVPFDSVKGLTVAAPEFSEEEFEKFADEPVYSPFEEM